MMIDNTRKIEIKNNIEEIKKQLSERDIKLIAVSKTKPYSDIECALDCGQVYFGENKPQEVRDKIPDNFDGKLHFIGNLQKNKIKYIIKKVDLIHSVDSISLWNAIDKEAKKADKIIDILLEINVSNEESKSGFNLEEVKDVINNFNDLSNTNLRGIMVMAPFYDNSEDTRPIFKKAKIVFDKLKDIINKEDFDTLSMGMSNDYLIAIEEGSNMIRVGSKIFGKRN